MHQPLLLVETYASRARRHLSSNFATTLINSGMSEVTLLNRADE